MAVDEYEDPVEELSPVEIQESQAVPDEAKNSSALVLPEEDETPNILQEEQAPVTPIMDQKKSPFKQHESASRDAESKWDVGVREPESAAR